LAFTSSRAPCLLRTRRTHHPRDLKHPSFSAVGERSLVGGSPAPTSHQVPFVVERDMYLMGFLSFTSFLRLFFFLFSSSARRRRQGQVGCFFPWYGGGHSFQNKALGMNTLRFRVLEWILFAEGGARASAPVGEDLVCIWPHPDLHRSIRRASRTTWLTPDARSGGCSRLFRKVDEDSLFLALNRTVMAPAREVLDPRPVSLLIAYFVERLPLAGVPRGFPYRPQDWFYQHIALSPRETHRGLFLASMWNFSCDDPLRTRWR